MSLPQQHQRFHHHQQQQHQQSVHPTSITQSSTFDYVALQQQHLMANQHHQSDLHRSAGPSNGNRMGSNNSNTNSGLTDSNPSFNGTTGNAAGGHSGPISAPNVEIKLFVGRIPRTYDDAGLRPIFSDFGTVRDVIIIRDRNTAAHKGCAFVRMASITKADAAIRALNNLKVLDPHLGRIQVKYAFGEAERLGLPVESAQPGVDQTKLFVGSLPKTAREEDIKSVFARYGQIDEVFVMRDEQKVSKGCAFVRFGYKEEAFYAISCLNGKYTVPGALRAMEVRFAENKKSPHPMSGDAGTGSMEPFHDINPAVAGRSMGTGIVWTEYFTVEGRPYYHNNHTLRTQWERPPEMDLIQHQNYLYNIVPGAIGAQTHGPPGANVFIFHIPNEWNEHDLIAHFSPFGQIVSARIATDKATGRRLGFGFVSFNRIEASAQAVMALNGYSITGKRLKVTIKRGEEHYAAPYFQTKDSPSVGSSVLDSMSPVHSAVSQHQHQHQTSMSAVQHQHALQQVQMTRLIGHSSATSGSHPVAASRYNTLGASIYSNKAPPSMVGNRLDLMTGNVMPSRQHQHEFRKNYQAQQAAATFTFHSNPYTTQQTATAH